MDSWGLVSVTLPENPWSWQPAAGSRAQYVTVLDPGSMDPTMRWDSTKEYGIGPDNFSKAFLQGIAQLGFEIVDFFFNRMLWPSAEQLKEQLEHFSGRRAEACPSKK